MNLLPSLPKQALLIAATAAAFALVTSASAQTTSMRMEIPFSFVAGDQTLPAGAYQVRVEESTCRVVILPAAETRILAFRLSLKSVSRKPANAELGTLQFQKYGDEYVLHAVWRPGQTEGHFFAQSKTERDLARLYSPAEVATIDSSR
ncbi:MAG TPA: hypothetical protein VE959_07955 [Bryobacteraceae bacterium]|nr:hypothetical protein [Bryobacteraceae bacterium]